MSFLTRGKQRGYGIITDPAMPVCEEVDSFTCAHCGFVEWLKPPTVRGNVVIETNESVCGYCTCCDKRICRNCMGKGCRPLERWLERMEARRSYGF